MNISARSMRRHNCLCCPRVPALHGDNACVPSSIADFILVHVTTHVPRSASQRLAPAARPRPPRASTRRVGGLWRLEMTGCQQIRTDSGLCLPAICARRNNVPLELYATRRHRATRRHCKHYRLQSFFLASNTTRFLLCLKIRILLDTRQRTTAAERLPPIYSV